VRRVGTLLGSRGCEIRVSATADNHRRTKTREDEVMSDLLESLVQNDRLYRLLAFYQQAGEVDREAWHDRVVDWEGEQPEDLIRWHGELLASAWIELNTGATPALAPGRACRCYRVTPAGRQAVKRAREQRDEGPGRGERGEEGG
jgi:hypothetical protein